jgi:hypothetical protein
MLRQGLLYPSVILFVQRESVKIPDRLPQIFCVRGTEGLRQP